jgi:hypothetical protein
MLVSLLRQRPRDLQINNYYPTHQSLRLVPGSQNEYRGTTKKPRIGNPKRRIEIEVEAGNRGEDEETERAT